MSVDQHLGHRIQTRQWEMGTVEPLSAQRCWTVARTGRSALCWQPLPGIAPVAAHAWAAKPRTLAGGGQLPDGWIHPFLSEPRAPMTSST